MSRWQPFNEGMEVVVRGGDETARGIIVETFPDRMVIEIQGKETISISVRRFESFPREPRAVFRPKPASSGETRPRRELP